VTRTRLAAWVSALLNPSVALGALVAALSLREPNPIRAWSAALGIAFTTIVPLASAAALWRVGLVSDLDLRVRHERQPVYLASAASYAVGAAALLALGGRWVPLTMLVQLATAGLAAALNRLLKVSMHALALSGVAVAALIVAGPGAWPVGLALPAGAWARWAAGAHSPAELAAGAALGGATALVGFGALVTLLGA
jgi:hypothetical protein